ncbi:MAG: hypothetical protein H6610_10995 [Ignavibacteriales bacterium]|nr:hypothetical protein [Ignavibacteriota bacterium]MCB9219969.1 hypothetical protein [Ignavibacteriales bacterium]
MKDITIPLPEFLEEQIAEVEVKINGKKRQYNFRMESFSWDVSTSGVENKDIISTKIENLRSQLENYSKNWELIQIFTPREGSKNIQVLFRQKQIL